MTRINYTKIVSKQQWKSTGHSNSYPNMYIMILVAATAAKSLQSCPTLCDPIDGSPPGSPVHGILQARTLEWIAISFSSAWKWKVKVKLPSRVWLFATQWTAAHQAPLSMKFSMDLGRMQLKASLTWRNHLSSIYDQNFSRTFVPAFQNWYKADNI